MAGTRRRGRSVEEDEALEKELRADPKELAEHVMLIDLGRNDVGRVAAPGSVRLDDIMVVERYSHVMHLVSNVSGTLVDGLSAKDVVRAVWRYRSTIHSGRAWPEFAEFHVHYPLKRSKYSSHYYFRQLAGRDCDACPGSAGHSDDIEEGRCAAGGVGAGGAGLDRARRRGTTLPDHVALLLGQ